MKTTTRAAPEQQRQAARAGRQGTHLAMPLRGAAPVSPLLQRQCACGGGCTSCQTDKLSQSKLRVSTPGDLFEREADRIAEAVLSPPQLHTAPSASETTRATDAEAGLQRTAAGVELANGAPPLVHDVLRSPGEPLDASVRAFMEPRFGHDLSQVRVHTDARAAESARAVNALAYTVGQNVVFGPGEYAPRSIAGRWLLAHELVHVLQQSSHVVRPGATLSGHPPSTFLERGATHIGNSSAYINAETTSQPEPLTQGTMHASPRRTVSVHHEPRAMIQRQEMCGPQGGTPSQSTANVIYDYENQVCRIPYADEIAASIPEADLVDGEFWIWPSGLREGTRPIFDDEDTSVIVGLRYSSGGYYKIYDLEGNMVESGEPGLETPLIDPIDIVAGGIAGLGRGLIRGGGRAVARGVAGGVGRGGGAALARTGLVATIRALSRRTITAIRGGLPCNSFPRRSKLYRYHYCAHG